MSSSTPRTLRIKRKRDEAPVDLLHVEQQTKRVAINSNESIVYRRVAADETPTSPLHGSGPRQYQIARNTRTLGELLVVVERKDGFQRVTEDQSTVTQPASAPEGASEYATASVLSENVQPERKRPRVGPDAQTKVTGEALAKLEGPTEEDMRELQELAQEVEMKETPAVPITATPIKKPLKFKPKAPALRFKDRHPEEAKRMAQEDADAMDVDDYVYDTFIQDVEMTDVKSPAEKTGEGAVGVLQITEADEDLWEEYLQEGVVEQDSSYGTDEEDENDENWYGNDYPEDEVETDDEFDVNPYKYNHGDEEEYDAERSDWSDEEVEDLKYPWKKAPANDNEEE